MKNCICLLFVWLLALPTGPPAWAQHTLEEIEGTSKIRGKIVSADGGPAIRGSRVLAFHLSSARLYASEPVRGGGFEIPDLPYGYYDLAVETTEGLFASTRAINLAPSGVAAIVLTIMPYGPATAGLARTFPGSDVEASGMAEVRQKLRGREFWKSPAGVAILAGAGGAALLFLAAGSEPEQVATVVLP